MTTEKDDSSNKKEICQWCGKEASSYNSIFVPGENKNLRICLHCYNREISKAAGIEYEDIQLHPVVIRDIDDIDHEFHFSLRLMGEQQVLSAFEVKGKFPAGYEFSMIGETENGIFSLFSKLYERMLKTLNRKHIFKNAGIDQWQITDDDKVRGQISCIDDEVGHSRVPILMIDGKKIAWDEFGKMLMTYEGFNFKLQIFDQSDEMD